MSKTKLDLQAFALERGRVSLSLQGLADIAGDLGAHNVREELSWSCRDLASDTFRVAIVGEFSRGKSTFINALVGTKILPSSVAPTTTVLTEIVHGEETLHVLRYRDVSEEAHISQEAFLSLIAPMEPSAHNAEERSEYDRRLMELRRVEKVTIFHPLQEAHFGIRILDTPGTNDLDPMREQITFDIIPRADAVVFLLSARQALTETEMDFLRSRVLKADVEKIFFILNHADRLSEDQLSSVLNDTISRIDAIVPSARVYPISARNVLRARTQNVPDPLWGPRFEAFEKDLAYFLLHERMEAKLAKPRSHGRRLRDEMRLGPLAIRKASLGADLPTLNAALEHGGVQLEAALHAHAVEMARLQVRLEHSRLDILSELRTGLHGIAKAAIDALAGYEGKLDDDNLQRHIETSVASVQQAFHTQFRASVEAAVRKSLDASEGQINNAMRLATEGMQSLGVVQPLLLSRSDTAHSLSDGEKFFITAGAVGLGLIFSPFATPIAFAAGRALTGWLTASGREQALKEMRALLEERYRLPIPATLERFQSSWDLMTRTIVDSTDSSFRGRLADLRQAYESVIAEIQTAKVDIAKEEAWLQSLESRMSQVSLGLEWTS